MSRQVIVIKQKRFVTFLLRASMQLDRAKVSTNDQLYVYNHDLPASSESVPCAGWLTAGIVSF
jgi:hypothetical protein